MSEYKIIEVKCAEMKMRVANLGGIIMSLHAPDASGRSADVVLGHDTLSEYLKSNCFFGALIGRVGNRISGGKFSIGNKKYKVAVNEKANNNHLHGGVKGFDKVIWDIDTCSGDGWKGVVLHRISKDGEEGYPGNLDITVFYRLTEDNSLAIEYSAFTDKPTLCNLTNHSYFNLSGGKSKDILSHEIQINADFYTNNNAKYIPTGEILNVSKTPLDLRKPTAIGKGIEMGGRLITEANGGYDHNFVLRNSSCDLVNAANVFDPKTGRTMSVYTTEPAMQFYSANFVNNVKGKNGATYNKYAGLCLETQHCPDAVHNPHFAGIELYPEDTYTSATVYSFGA